MSDIENGKTAQEAEQHTAQSGATHVEIGDEKLISFVGPTNKESTYARNSPEMMFGVLSKPKTN